jgi:hypothetical protein
MNFKTHNPSAKPDRSNISLDNLKFYRVSVVFLASDGIDEETIANEAQNSISGNSFQGLSENATVEISDVTLKDLEEFHTKNSDSYEVFYEPTDDYLSLSRIIDQIKGNKVDKKPKKK